MNNQLELPRFEGLPSLSDLEVFDEDDSPALDFSQSFWVGSIATSHVNAAQAFRVAIDLRDLTMIARFQEISDSLLFAIIVKVKGHEDTWSLIVVETSGPDQQLVAKLDGVRMSVIEKVHPYAATSPAEALKPQIRWADILTALYK